MYEIDPDRTELAAEFLADPTGRHSAELHRVLNRLRLPIGPTDVIVVLDDGRYALATTRPAPHLPALVDGAVYASLDDALRMQFARQWAAVTGRELAPELGVPAPTAGPEPVLPMKYVAGYLDRVSARPGDRVRVFASSERPGNVAASFVRIVHADGFPDGPGVHVDVVTELATFPGRTQTVTPGSLVWLGARPAFAVPGRVRVAFDIAPHGRRDDPQTVLGNWRADGTGFAVGIEGRDHQVFVRVGADTHATGIALPTDLWSHVEVAIEPDSRALSVAVAPLVREQRGGTFDVENIEYVPGAGAMVIGARVDVIDVSEHLDASLAAPRVHIDDGVAAAWDFAPGVSSTKVHDTGPHALHGRTVHRPQRAVVGPRWTGRTTDWREAPHEYDAIRFRSDDLADVGWEPDVTFTVPDVPSGVYGVRLDDGHRVDDIPLFVRRPASAAPARVAYLAPTATYVAYGNYRLVDDGPGKQFAEASAPLVTADDLLLHRHPEWGSSTYDFHRDGSGIGIASRHRPLLSMRPGGVRWGFVADSHITDWLAATDVDFEVLTDDDLHDEGVDALDGYRVLVTGTHPEYWSTAMLDALTAWLDRGGRLMYLGGNGFYWRIAYAPLDSGVLEVCRVDTGTGSWRSAPGAAHHSFSGEPGGLWRRVGRAPNALVGVGFAAQGFDESAPYRVHRRSIDTRTEWILEGVDGDVIGAHGRIGGGAAGWEIDRADPALGTPAHTVVLASSFGHTGAYRHCVEELTVNLPLVDGIEDPSVRADLVFFETHAGGAVFSTGSIAWAGALAPHDTTNDVYAISTNVLTRFAADDGFSVPH